MDWSRVVDGLFAGIGPFLPWLAVIGTLMIVLAAPLPGRGPGFFRGRDPWRGFKFDARRAVLALASNRCEGAAMVAWGRCGRPAEEVDHVYPWSKGGATIVSNGQALCKVHNRRKSNRTPAWWYVLSLERRRKAYYPAGASVRVCGAMAPTDKAAREASVHRRVRKGP